MSISFSSKVVFFILIGMIATPSFAQQLDVAPPKGFWKNFYKSFENKSYDAAWQQLNSADFESPDLHFHRGVMLFSGFGTPADRCKAVAEFEIAREGNHPIAYTFLQHLYNGAYTAIAAEEGQPRALWELAEQKWNSYQLGNIAKTFSNLEALKEIYIYVKKAEEHGASYYEMSTVTSLIVAGLIRQEGGTPPEVSIEFKEVICPPRKGD